MKLEDIPFHDATLKSIYFKWAERTCIIDISIWNFPNSVLFFNNVTEIIIPRQDEWGPSSSINKVRNIGTNLFEIEIQSGDVIRINASEWSFDQKISDKDI